MPRIDRKISGLERSIDEIYRDVEGEHERTTPDRISLIN